MLQRCRQLMKPYSNILCLTIIFLLFSFRLHGQNIATLRSQKVLTISQIDSICKSIDTNKSLVEGIAEGGFVNQKGGWETYDLKSNRGDTLFRIRHNSATDLYYKTTFYYFDKKVIKCIYEIENRNSGNSMNPFYSVTYYFENDKPIKVLNEDHKYSTASYILTQGQNYQDNFYRDR